MTPVHADARTAAVQPDQPYRLRHRDDLQGLRAVAVALVALGHADVPHLAGGFVGVDVFFVLSGYLITGLLLNEARAGHGSLAEFYKRRVKRILPAATLTLVTTAIAAYLLLNTVRAKEVLNDAIWASVFAANIHFARVGTNYFASTQPPSPLQHFWTLAVEEQFYVVWPALLLAIVTLGVRRNHRGNLRFRRIRRRDRRIPVLLVVAGVITAVSLALSIQADGSTASYFSTVTRAWELGLGCILAIVFVRGLQLPKPVQYVAGWAGLAAIVVAAVTYSASTPFPGYAALLPTLGAAAVIASTVGAAKVLALPPLRYVGDRSYTLYLWHWPFLVLAADRASHPLSLTTKLALVAAAFVVSVVTYAVYENPLRRLEWENGAAVTFVAASVFAILVISAFGIQRIDTRTAASQAAPIVQDSFGPTPAQEARLNKQLDKEISGGELAAVDAAVAAGQRHAPLPAGLNPPPSTLLGSAARYDFPGGCGASNGQTTSQVCALGDTAASRTMVVVGDSHAQMWMPAILAAATRDHWRVVPISKSSCGITQWGGGPANGGSAAECNTWFTWAVGQVRAQHPAVVVVGSQYAQSDGNGPVGTASVAGLQRLVAALPHVRVAMIEDPPGQLQQPTDCLLGSHATMACATTFPAATMSNDDEVTAGLGAVADVTMLSTLGWFCAGDTCPMVIGHTVVFVDHTHISVAYATAIEDLFRIALEHAIAASR